jgi:hypothetical protein
VYPSCSVKRLDFEEIALSLLHATPDFFLQHAAACFKLGLQSLQLIVIEIF